MPREQALELLRRHYLFAALGDSQFAALQPAITLRRLAPHEVLFQRGDPAAQFFVALEGEVRLYLQSRGGEEKVVDVIAPGQSFAEAVMFMEMPIYPVSADGRDEAGIAAIASAPYVELLRSNSKACLHLLADLSRRLHGLVRDIEALTLESAQSRLLRYLLARLGTVPAGPSILHLEEPKNMLAARLDMKPETLSRILRSLADERLIEVEGRQIRIPDVTRLQAVS
jgi:CRP/FNR family transcriptional regulator, dissimilatory nitrate respiration regulator